jgi:hypothetical protein
MTGNLKGNQERTQEFRQGLFMMLTKTRRKSGLSR